MSPIDPWLHVTQTPPKMGACYYRHLWQYQQLHIATTYLQFGTLRYIALPRKYRLLFAEFASSTFSRFLIHDTL